ncbi:hypothetical protein NO932_06430 [Pelagibacterium sp. 26DY04]|nr:hypothetical protein [Pelagibacterium sp. 26DY04]WMT88241.1 hypothetical protein NO932_06430 [Pelagibacterium sp. 26DY04]
MTALSTLKGALAFIALSALYLSALWPLRHDGESIIEVLMKVM